MALDRQSIEKKDFPIGRRGYDPDAVDRHLSAMADQVEPEADAQGVGLPSVLIAHTGAELSAGYRMLESPLGPQVMLQDYVPGGSDSIWMFNGYFDRGAECRCAFTARKLRQRGPHTGPTTLGVCDWLWAFKTNGQHQQQIKAFLDFALQDKYQEAFDNLYDLLPVTTSATVGPARYHQ